MKVVCLTGFGRCGSTLLDRILGELPDFTSLGEVRDLFDTRGFADHKCSCGQGLLACDFWSDVLPAALAASDLDESRSIALRGSEERQRHIPRLWWELARSDRFVSRLAARKSELRLNPYGELLVNLYEAALAHEGTKVLIDSSKFVSDVLILARDPRVDLHVVHLVRDPRASAFSWSKPKVDPGRQSGDGALQSFSPAMGSFWWTANNAEAELFIRRRLGSRYQRVRYEDFVSEPRRVIGSIVARIGADPGDLPFDGPDTVELTKASHIVGGNPNRFEAGAIKLRLDERWRSGMPDADIYRATLPALPLLWRYGYPLRPR